MTDKIYLTPEDVIERSPFGRTFVYSELKSGRLKSARVGKRYVITPESMHEWLTSNATTIGLEGRARGPGTGYRGAG